MLNTGPIGHIVIYNDFVQSSDVIVYISALERLFLSNMLFHVLFLMKLFQLKIQCPVQDFCYNTIIETQFLTFSTNIRRFSNKLIPVWPQRDIIFGVRGKHWVNLCVLNMIFVSVKFLLLVSLRHLGGKLTKTNSRENNVKHARVSLAFCVDSKYNIYLRSKGTYSVQKPSNISQKWQKLSFTSSITVKVLY